MPSLDDNGTKFLKKNSNTCMWRDYKQIYTWQTIGNQKGSLKISVQVSEQSITKTFNDWGLHARHWLNELYFSKSLLCYSKYRYRIM